MRGGPMNREDLELLVRKAEFFREEQGVLTSARFDLRKLERVVGK